MKNFILLFPLAFLFIISSACRTLNRNDDALRIKKDSAYKYSAYPFDYNVVRNGNTLRGTVLKFETVLIPDSCIPNRQPNFKAENRLIFLDIKSPNIRYLEYIPFEDVDFIGPKFGQPLNAIEDYNFPLEPKRFRFVPWDTVKVPCRECACQPFTLSLSVPCVFCPRCPTRACNWYFVELRGGYSTYKDKLTPTSSIWKDAFFGEATFGIRFGYHRQYGFGIMFSTGVPIYNSFTGEDILRPLALFHFRWDPFKSCIKPSENSSLGNIKIEQGFGTTELIDETRKEIQGLSLLKCFNPYFYVQGGLPIDGISLDLFKLNISRADCKNKIQASAPYLRINTVPFTYALGLGFDFPISSYVDFSIDAGWRSYAFGESQSLLGFRNVPSYRRINMFFIRTGLTL